ncbi:AAA family ATPase [Amycolatopsis sp. A133]|uniref:AAA family ATPase n=1 Tax=Amycolatopsis sp. A133 TaxID=3064472 RepID=UPI0027E9EA44|nr:AAA family ATPase [Amycolatopsis sp. A133]MDQ7806809.1 AAA family ATPase [Amycolatopsis sp. A133]
MLIERDFETATLSQMLADTHSGAGGVGLVLGPVASGKTALLEAFGRQAAGTGAVVLSASGARSETAVGLGVVSQLVHTPGVRADIAEQVSAYVEDAEADATLLDSRFLHRLSGAVIGWSAESPLVICVDDAHHADPASLQFLQHMARRIRPARVLVLLAERADPGERRPVRHVDLMRRPHCRQLRLAPLSRNGVGVLLAGKLDEGTARALAAECFAVSGGNPLLATALVHDTRIAGTGEVVAGAAYRHAVLSCLHSSEPRALELARALAVLGDDEQSQISLAGGMVSFAPATTEPVRRALESAGVLDGHRFRHAEARVAVLDELDPGVRSALHGQAARLLFDQGARPTAIAAHVVAGNVDEPWTEHLLSEASEAALLEDDVELARACIAMAGRCCTDDRDRAIAKASLADIEWRTTPAKAMRRLPELVHATRAGHLPGIRVVGIFEFLLWFGRVDEAVEIANAFGDLVDGRDRRTRGELLTLASWLTSSVPGMRHLVEPMLATITGDTTAPQLGLAVNSQLKAIDALTSAVREGPSEAAVLDAEQVLEGTRMTDITLRHLVFAATVLIYAERLDKAATWAEHLVAQAAGRPAPTWQASLAELRAEVALRQGDLPLAARNAEIALTKMTPEAWGIGVGAPLATLLAALTEMGRFDEAAELLNQPVPDALGETRFGLHYLHARGHYYLATGRLPTALNDFLACGEQMARWDLDQPSLVPWRSSAAEVHLKLGDREKARVLAEEQAAKLGPDCGDRTRGITLRTLALVADPARRPKLMQEAVDVLEKSGAKLELARTLAELSRACQAGGDAATARTASRDARVLAKECGAELLRKTLLDGGDDDVVVSLRGAVAPADVKLLTDAEQRVGWLAARGHTNREIASQLYITVSTVEQHLTRVYRKLSVSRRRDLAAEPQLRVPEQQERLPGMARQVAVNHRAPAPPVRRPLRPVPPVR